MQTTLKEMKWKVYKRKEKETFFPSEKRDFYLAFFADLTYSLLEVNYPKKRKALKRQLFTTTMN